MSNFVSSHDRIYLRRFVGLVFCRSGTKLVDGKWYTNGGRVLGVTAVGADFKKARERAYAATELIQFEGRHYRTDIAENLA